ncbi:MAG: glycosyltransferase family 4 protein [Minisyncoccales bacterium]
MKKIGLFSFHSFSQPGGVKNHILGLNQEFKKKGLETKIIVPRRRLFERYSKDVILLGSSFGFSFGGGDSDFDVVFTPLSIESVLIKEKFDVLHFHNFIFPAALQIINSPLSQKPLKILTFHSNLERSRMLKKFPFFVDFLIRVLNWKTDGLICVSNFILKFFLDYKKPKIVIPNGIDLNFFQPKKNFKKNKKIEILFVGRIEERKGLIFLLRAFKILSLKFNHLVLRVIGEGPLKKNCQEFVKKERLKNVFWEGKKEGKELLSFYQNCDIFVAPSIFGESFGIILLEAMACQKPVVAFNIDGYNEILKDEAAFFLAQKKDVYDLADKIEILIKNEALREKMGLWGRKESEKYSWERVANNVLEFYSFCQKEREKKAKN